MNKFDINPGSLVTVKKNASKECYIFSKNAVHSVTLNTVTLNAVKLWNNPRDAIVAFINMDHDNSVVGSFSSACCAIVIASLPLIQIDHYLPSDWCLLLTCSPTNPVLGWCCDISELEILSPTQRIE